MVLLLQVIPSFLLSQMFLEVNCVRYIRRGISSFPLHLPKCLPGCGRVGVGGKGTETQRSRPTSAT